MKPLIDQNGNITEESILPGYKWICQAPGYMGGQHAIFGMRVSVPFILECIEQGLSTAEIAEDYDLPLEAVQEAVRFAADRLEQRQSA